MKRALVFLAITFGITYAYDFLVVYPIAQGTAPYASEFLSPDLAYMVSVALTMLFPALGVVLTRLVTHEGFRNCVLKPRPWRQSLPWFVVAWFGPLLFVTAGAIVYFLAFPGDFDPNMTSFFTAQREAAAASGADGATLAADILEEAGKGELDPAALAGEGGSLMVTPRDIDQRVSDMAKVIGFGINLALQSGLTVEDVELFLS